MERKGTEEWNLGLAGKESDPKAGTVNEKV